MNSVRYIAVGLFLSAIAGSQKTAAFQDQRAKFKKCVTDIETRDMPRLGFMTGRNLYPGCYLADTLFAGYTIAKGYQNKKAMDMGEDAYMEFSKHSNRDAHRVKFDNRINTFQFIKQNGGYILAAARLEFRDENDGGKNQMVRGTTPMGLNMEKKAFARLFGIEGTLCDTVNVHNDTDQSLYFFKDGRIDKIIVENYID